MCRGEPDYAAVWCCPQTFNQIIIGRKMVFDHLPNVVDVALEQLVKKHFTLASNLFDDTIMSEFKKVAAAETRRRRTPLGPTSSGSGSSFPPASPDFGSVAEDLFFSEA